MQETDAQSLHSEYIRLTEKFKALWTFQQLLRGIHQTFLDGAPVVNVDLNKIYEDLRQAGAGISSSGMDNSAPERLNTIDTQIDLASRSLRLTDRALSPSLLRRFFGRARPQDEKIVFHILRFYFAQPEVDEDLSDKIDFLATFAATAPGGNGAIPLRFEDAVSAFQAVASHCTWPTTDPSEAAATVSALQDLSRDVATAPDFETLVSRGLIENIRMIKRQLGPALANPRVLAATAICNINTRTVFERLLQKEAERLQVSAGRIGEIEQEFSKSGANAVPTEFTHFRRIWDRYTRSQAEDNVRAQDVLAVRNSMANVLSRFDLGEVVPAEIEEAVELRSGKRDTSRALIDSPAPAPPALSSTIETSLQKILAVVEMNEDGTLKPAERMGLEPWEIRTAKRTLAAGGQPGSERDALLLEAAAVRVQAEEEGMRCRQALKMGTRLSTEFLQEVRSTLSISSGMETRFSRFIAEASEGSRPEEMRSLLRSRIRFLQSYTTLWILHDDLMQRNSP